MNDDYEEDELRKWCLQFATDQAPPATTWPVIFHLAERYYCFVRKQADPGMYVEVVHEEESEGK